MNDPSMNCLGIETSDGNRIWMGGLIADGVGALSVTDTHEGVRSTYAMAKPNLDQLRKIRDHISGLLSGMSEYEQAHIEQQRKKIERLEGFLLRAYAIKDLWSRSFVDEYLTEEGKREFAALDSMETQMRALIAHRLPEKGTE